MKNRSIAVGRRAHLGWPARITFVLSLLLSVLLAPAGAAQAQAPTLTSSTPAVGQPGTVLSLTGTNLTGATAILFAGSSNNVVSTGFTVASATSITGISVPAGAQSGPVRVRTASGTSVVVGSVFFTRAQIVAGGANYTVQVRADGTLWTWGSNSYGQLGDGTTTQRTSPVQVGAATNWVSAAAANNGRATLAVQADGTLWAWGYNGQGQVGDGTTTNRLSPVRVGAATNWVSAATSQYHTVAVQADGTLWAWGFNSIGQLGDGTTNQRLSPGQVGTATNWVSAAAGVSYTVAVQADGTLWAWGYNGQGQLGDGTTNQRSSPVRVGTATNWVSVAAGNNYTVAVQADGTLWAWGSNAYGQLGDGTTTNRLSPGQVGAATNWVSAAAGSGHTVAVRADGTLWAWGYNAYGELGDGTTNQRTSPGQVGAATNWVSAAAGGGHTVAVQTACGSLWAWGYNNSGQVGDGSTTDRLSPVQVYAPPASTLVSFSPASAAPGASVAVSGTGLLGLTALSVNGAPVALANISNNTSAGFTFVVPAGATATGTTTASVSCGPTSSTGFTAVVPTIASFSPTSGPVGTVLSLTGTNLTGTTAITFAGSSNNVVSTGFTVASATSITGIAVPAGAITGTLTVTTSSISQASPASFTVCAAPVAVAQNVSVLLDASGNAIVAATAVNNGSTADCGVAPNSALSLSKTSFTCANLGANPVTLTVTDTGGNKATAPATVTVTAATPTTTWNGSASTDWADCANWSYGKVPDAATNAVVPTGQPRYPNLASGTFSVLSLTIDSGGSLTLASGATLQVNGSFANNGTASLPGTVAFAGSAAQSLGGSTATAFGTVAVNKTGGTVTLTRDLAIGSALALTSGTLTTGTYQVALGTAASLTESDAGYVVGRVALTRVLVPGTAEAFSGLGLLLTPAAGSTAPGTTLVSRTTGVPLGGAGTSQSVLRYFDIQPATNTGLSVTMAFAYFAHELNGIPTPNLSLFKSETTTAGPWAPQRLVTLSPSTVTKAGITDFSIWTLGNSASPLPVELTAFTASADGPAAVRLAWTTASERNSRAFEVERSADGQAFAPIGTVAAAGSSSVSRSYGFRDAQLPGAPLLYYRLHQLDLDGTATYSPVRTVLHGQGPAAFSLHLFPNPAHTGATLTGTAPGTVVTVFDALGRPVASARADATGTAILALPAGQPAGIYVVRAGRAALRLTVE